MAADLVMGITDMVEDLEVSFLFWWWWFSSDSETFLHSCTIFVKFLLIYINFFGFKKYTWLLAHIKPLYYKLYGYFLDSHAFSLE